ncbi:hypothetical protein V2V48_27690, partial [Pseudomonas aeruginosa]|uniref:hypothetical protein n=1 Tax=Pseudomonas aeruginosa TaxID=287 RepID=UPI00313626EB
GRVHLAFLCFTHLLSSFRGRQLKLPRSHCLKRWIHYSLKRLDSDLVVKSLSPVAANITKAFLSTGEELTPTAMTVISQLTLEVSKAAADGIPSTDAEVQALVAKAVANLRGAK